jgi:uncharacterized protein (TIGR03083 family)
MDPINVFQRAVDQTGRIVAGVRADQFDGATPCDDWNVHALLNHTIAAVQMFDGAASGAEFDPSNFAKDNVGDNPGAGYDTAAAKLRDTVAQPGVLDAIWNMPFGAVPGSMAIGIATLEIAQHAEVTETAMATARMAPAELIRSPGVFGPESPCPPEAPPHDQLAAFVGRKV